MKEDIIKIKFQNNFPIYYFYYCLNLTVLRFEQCSYTMVSTLCGTIFFAIHTNVVHTNVVISSLS
jgi:hypothetical protein